MLDVQGTLGNLPKTSRKEEEEQQQQEGEEVVIKLSTIVIKFFLITCLSGCY